MRYLYSVLCAPLLLITLMSCDTHFLDKQADTEALSTTEQAFLESLNADPILYSPLTNPALHKKLIWVATEKNKRLIKQLGLEAEAIGQETLNLQGEYNIKTKILTIALHRKQRPLEFTRLETDYLATKATDSIKQSTQKLDPQDVSEANRLIWENMILLPFAYDGQPGYIETALTALARIQNPASVVSIMAFSKKCDQLQKAQHEIVASYYELALKTLLNIPSAQSANGLQDIYLRAKTRQSQGFNFPTSWPEAYIFEFFDSVSDTQKSEWLNIIGDSPEDRLFIGIRDQLRRSS